MSQTQTQMMVFPGQGSQCVGMLSELAAVFPSVYTWFSRASEVLGYDLWHLVQTDAAKLDDTRYTQPALLVASVAMYACWREAGGEIPRMMAGHSLGEYSALVCAEAVSFEEGVQLVAARGHLMQEAVPEGVGAMAAVIGLSREAVEALCRDTVTDNEILVPANDNAPGQIVIAGHAAAVDRAVIAAKAGGAKLAKRLAVSVPSHSPLMRHAADAFAEKLAAATITAPKIPVWHNADVAMHTNPQTIREVLVSQLVSPVRWVETIQQCVIHGITRAIECGPGKVLAGLNKRMSSPLETVSIELPEMLQAAIGESV